MRGTNRDDSRSLLEKLRVRAQSNESYGLRGIVKPYEKEVTFYMTFHAAFVVTRQQVRPEFSLDFARRLEIQKYLLERSYLLLLMLIFL